MPTNTFIIYTFSAKWRGLRAQKYFAVPRPDVRVHVSGDVVRVRVERTRVRAVVRVPAENQAASPDSLKTFKNRPLTRYYFLPRRVRSRGRGRLKAALTMARAEYSRAATRCAGTRKRGRGSSTRRTHPRARRGARPRRKSGRAYSV